MNSREWMSSTEMSDCLNRILLSENALDDIEDIRMLQGLFLYALSIFRFGRARKNIKKAVDVMHGASSLFDTSNGALIVFPFERILIMKCIHEILKRL